MKILYVSDLDGTLLRKNETLSSYTIKTINALTSSGMSFSYATARSLNTAKKVPVNSFEFHRCRRTPQVAHLILSLNPVQYIAQNQ